MDRSEALEAARKAERLDPIERARRNPKSRKLAIAGKCFDCQGGDADPGIRRRIRECSITRCTLHGFRPYQRSDDVDDEEAADAIAWAEADLVDGGPLSLLDGEAEP